eukprot:COSAG05_NODE_14543_length_394_cov_0.691525_1_plen_20_part_01
MLSVFRDFDRTEDGVLPLGE